MRIATSVPRYRNQPPARLRALAAATPGSVEQLLEPRPPSATGMANDPGAWARLTDSEQHVLRLIAAGRSNVENASELVISVRTVERHIGNLYEKIGARNRTEAVVYAVAA